MCSKFQLHEPFSLRSNLFHHLSNLCPDASHWTFLTLLTYSTTFRNPFLIYYSNLLLTSKDKYGNTSRSDAVFIKANDTPIVNSGDSLIPDNRQRMLQILFHKWDPLLCLFTNRKLTALLLNQKYWLDGINTKISILSKASYMLFTCSLRGSTGQARNALSHWNRKWVLKMLGKMIIEPLHTSCTVCIACISYNPNIQWIK